jgi:hypothetical protein
MTPMFQPRVALLLSALLTSPAWALTTVYPGTMCTFDGPVSLPTSGALLNASEGYNTTSKLHCPVPRLVPYAVGKTLKVKVNVLLNNHLNTNPWTCVLRTTTAAGVVVHEKVHNLEGAIYPTVNWTFSFETIVLDSGSRSYNLRCNVPDKTSTMAGIISYEVTE